MEVGGETCKVGGVEDGRKWSVVSRSWQGRGAWTTWNRVQSSGFRIQLAWGMESATLILEPETWNPEIVNRK